ncbi:hypothetical protein ACFL40_01455 [candidate division KSB1 bacterium]
MWTILKAEFNYNRTLLLVLAAAVVYSIIMESLSPRITDYGWLNFIITFLIVGNFINSMSKEKRIRSLSLLPISKKRIASARIMMVLIPIVTLFLLYLVFYYIKVILPYNSPRDYSFGVRIYFNPPLILNTIFIIAFSVYFILYDIFAHKLESLSGNVSIVAVVVIMLFGAVIFNKMFSYVNFPVSGKRIIEFIVTHNPFQGEYGMHKLVAFTFLLSLTSIVTFLKRKTYLV